MHRLPERSVAAWLMSAGLAGCAATTARAPHAPPAPLPGTEACIFTVNLFDWTVLDDTTIIVYAPGNKQPYLVKLFAPIFDLGFHQTLGFEDVEHNGQLCKGDYVLVRGDTPERSSIDAVRRLTPDQAKELIANSRHGGKPATVPAAAGTAAAGAAPQ
ncbi:MAG TPA: DUF6491 family protein [Steroidobacteraceae bacterium]|jgi:hypothetical protein